MKKTEINDKIKSFTQSELVKCTHCDNNVYQQPEIKYTLIENKWELFCQHCRKHRYIPVSDLRN